MSKIVKLVLELENTANNSENYTQQHIKLTDHLATSWGAGVPSTKEGSFSNLR